MSVRKTMIIGALTAATVLGESAAFAAERPRSGLYLTHTVRYGDRGDEVRRLQARLRSLKFDPGPVNGRFGRETRTALWAFQKANGLRPSDVAGRTTSHRLLLPRLFVPKVPGGPRRHVEIDLRRQLLTVWKGGRPALISHISTGANRHYCDHGHCGFARTPRGNYRAGRKSKGWRIGPLGGMFFPTYFDGGIAMHGSINVPARPASHGCVRVPMHNAVKLYRLVPSGTAVYVR